MGRRILISGFVVGFLMIPFLVRAEIYKWVDRNGTIHFTDDYGNIPSSYPEGAGVEIRKDAREDRVVSEPQKKMNPGVREEQIISFVETDEVWREERTRSWTEKLQEATVNYENAQRRFLEKAEELSRRRFGSPTMYKFDIIKLDVLNQERLKYKAQLEEADEMLKKFANPDFWGAAAVMGEEKSTDIYGIGGDWWRDRIRALKERQEELNARYRDAERKFIGQTVELSKRRYGNRHTIKAKILELDRANQEALKYLSQIAENEEVTERILKDAEESGADPEWVK